MQFACIQDKQQIDHDGRDILQHDAGTHDEKQQVVEEDYGEEDVNKICREIAGFVEAAGGKCEIITDRVEGCSS